MSVEVASPRRLISPHAEGVVLLVATAVSWGINWPIAKFVLSELPPFSMRTLCSALGIGFAFALAWLCGEKLRPPRGQWGPLAVYATLNYGAFAVFTTLSLWWLQASEAIIITYTLPIWAGLMAWPLLGERPTPARVTGMLLGIGGVTLLVGANGIQASWTTLPGILSGLLASWLFGLGTVIAKRHPLAMPRVAGVAWQATLGVIPVALLALGEHPIWGRVSALGWSGCLYIALLPMTLSYLFWFRALRLLPASTASVGLLLAPAVGVFASAALLGDPLGPRQLIALAVTLAGVTLSARS